MPRKPITPFETGLASKIYWCVYVQPNLTHRIANIIRGKYAKKGAGERKKGGLSDTSQVTQVIGKLERAGFLKRDDDRKYHIVVYKIVSALQNILNKEKSSLDLFSASILNIVIDSPITRMNFAITQPLTRLSKHPDKKMSFMLSFTTVISLSSLGALDHIKEHPEEKNWLRNKVREYNAKITGTNPNAHPITKEQYFAAYVRSLEEYLRSGSKGNKLLRCIEKEITSTNDFNQNLVAILWFIMLMKIPESVLIKMVKLNKNATMVHDLITLRGKIFEMPSQEAFEHLKSLYTLYVSDNVKFTDLLTNESS